jgi:ribose 1,5-bisphosphokinase PhnN
LHRHQDDDSIVVLMGPDYEALASRIATQITERLTVRLTNNVNVAVTLSLTAVAREMEGRLTEQARTNADSIDARLSRIESMLAEQNPDFSVVLESDEVALATVESPPQ